MKIGNRNYTVHKVFTRQNVDGQTETWTALKGSRGAEVLLIEIDFDWGTGARLIHFGRKNSAETINPLTIQR
tara:strand:- start:262 stop:477 length:216 start_codon:yes stop_codon:yes gene_type:complete